LLKVFEYKIAQLWAACKDTICIAPSKVTQVLTGPSRRGKAGKFSWGFRNLGASPSLKNIFVICMTAKLII